MGIPVVWCEPTGEAIVTLRRFVFSSEQAEPCSGPWRYHHAVSGPVDRIPYVMVQGGTEEAGGFRHDHWPLIRPESYADNPWWPVFCPCGYRFTDADERQANGDPLYRATDGREFGWGDAPAGAMRDARWSRVGPDGISLQVRCPRDDGAAPGISDDWLVDSRATNCTMKDELTHYCWVRAGDPRAVPPTVTVSKDGFSCAAGAGSIRTAAWHGFLRDGELVP